jgi:hypothetical protein
MANVFGNVVCRWKLLENTIYCSVSTFLLEKSNGIGNFNPRSRAISTVNYGMFSESNFLGV